VFGTLTVWQVPLVQVWPTAQHVPPHTNPFAQQVELLRQVAPAAQQVEPHTVPLHTFWHRPPTQLCPVAQQTPLHACAVGQHALFKHTDAELQQVWLPTVPHRLLASQQMPVMQLCVAEQHEVDAPEPHTLALLQQLPLTQVLPAAHAGEQVELLTQAPFWQVWLLAQQAVCVPTPHMFDDAQHTPPTQVCVPWQHWMALPVPQVCEVAQHAPCTQVCWPLHFTPEQLPTHWPVALSHVCPVEQHTCEPAAPHAVVQHRLLTQVWPAAQVTPPQMVSQV
jgi:hypothetical protein